MSRVVRQLPADDGTNGWSAVLEQRTRHVPLQGDAEFDWVVVGLAGFEFVAFPEFASPTARLIESIVFKLGLVAAASPLEHVLHDCQGGINLKRALKCVASLHSKEFTEAAVSGSFDT